MMNDFTKEELEIIHLDICVYLNKSTLLDPPQHHIDLRDKVREMIDNYCNSPCKHEWVRLRLLSQKDYDFCEHCMQVMRMR